MNNAGFWKSIDGIIAEGFTPEGLQKLDHYAELFINGRLVYKRFSPFEQHGCATGGTTHVVASLLAGAEIASDRRRPEFYASRIFVDIADFSGSEHKTFDIGMVFLHEFQHAYFGLSDNVDRFKEIYSCKDPYYYKKGYRGDVVDKVNIYRKGLGLPTREAYKKSPFTNKIPFSDGKNTLWLDGWE